MTAGGAPAPSGSACAVPDSRPVGEVVEPASGDVPHGVEVGPGPSVVEHPVATTAASRARRARRLPTPRSGHRPVVPGQRRRRLPSRARLHPAVTIDAAAARRRGKADPRRAFRHRHTPGPRPERPAALCQRLRGQRGGPGREHHRRDRVAVPLGEQSGPGAVERLAPQPVPHVGFCGARGARRPAASYRTRHPSASGRHTRSTSSATRIDSSNPAVHAARRTIRAALGTYATRP